MATLDLKEGTPEVYRWKITEVLLPDGSSARAVVYNLPSTRPSVPVPPALGYLGIVVAGLKGYGHSVIRLLAAAQGTDDAQNVPLFCSGTLMLGAALHGVMCSLGAWFLGDAEVHGLLAGLDDFPGFQPGGGQIIRGQLFEFSGPGAALYLLDRLEGFHDFGVPQSLCWRGLLRAQACGGNCMAWAYIIVQGEGPVIESGDWRNRKKSDRAGGKR